MLKQLCSTIFGTGLVFAVASAPAVAQDSVEAKVVVCAACHGQNGQASDPKIIPPIWGQQVSYLVKQLHDYRNGERESPIMTPIAKTLALADLRKVSEYFAAKTWPAHPAAAPAGAAPEGIAQCQACHQPNFEGGPPAPRLAGLSYEYLIGAMNAFADDKRTNNGDMPKLMKALTPEQREAMAKYLAAL